MSTIRRGPKGSDVDHLVGARMRERRIMLGLTQSQLATLMGVTYQQAHKYEKGVNRISAGRLWQAAQALTTDVAYFYEGAGGGVVKLPPSKDRRTWLDLATHFARCSPREQAAVVALTRRLAKADAADTARLNFELRTTGAQ